MKNNSFLFFRLAKPLRKFISLFLIVLMLVQTFAPTISYALTSGPTQPEVQSFEPVSTSDMVDLFTGDFKYNIPLLDVDGYPVNLSYHSGVTMDEEASWVGLGWNINVGTVNRAMRGIPDDFAGDVIKKEMNLKSNNTYGISGGIDLELAGFPLKLSKGIGGKFNTYKGMSLEKSVNVSINSGQQMKGPLTASIGLTSSTDEGLTIQPSLSLSTAGKKAESRDVDLSCGLSMGTSFNSRAGLKQISLNTSVTNSYKKVYSSLGKTSHTRLGFSPSTSFDIGMPTYTFTGSMPMSTFSITGTFKLGMENPPISFPDLYANGYYVHQALTQTEVDRPSYGYMNLDLGSNNDQALLDFNRENDGEYLPNSTPNLPVTNLTNDLFSVTGQGIGGSYRSLRSDVGYVFDPFTKTNSNAFNVSAELGVGEIIHGGYDLGITFTDTRCGRWIDGNALGSKLKYTTATTNPLFEKYYLVEANEMPAQSNQLVENHFGGFDAVRPNLIGPNFNRIASASLSPTGNVTTNYRPERESRNQVISIIAGADKKKGFGIELLHPQAYNTQETDHHIGEIQVTGTDGSRYIYGIAAYNTMQKEVTFATGEGLLQQPSSLVGLSDAGTGLIKDYPEGEASTGNIHGIDNYYSANTIPAYAHSFLLTDILSADYIDADNVQGPSDGDMGSYTRFYYSKHSSEDFKWRTPLIKADSANDVASYNEGLKSDQSDDKANYIYGTKELWYLDSIVTKNYIAIFDKEPRHDGLGVTNERGVVDELLSHAPKLLRSIRLYTKPAYRTDPLHASPIKVVNFEYRYSLCNNVPNSIEGGKLTLTKVYFTYQSSQKGRLSPYKFSYGKVTGQNRNPDYNSRSVDRWGNYKPNSSSASWFPDNNGNEFSNADDPYVIQDSTLAAQYASVWQLDTIKLPSGGKITVTYEADDYAYVQNQQAGEMFKVIQYGDAPTDINLVPGGGNTYKIYFPLQSHFESPNDVYYEDIKDYIGDLQYVYFKFLMKVLDSGSYPYDFVSGYGEIIPGACGIDASNHRGYITLKSVTLKDNGGSEVTPMTKCAIQFARLHLTRLAYGTPNEQDQGISAAIINTVAQFFIMTIPNIIGAAEGPNWYLYNTKGIGKEAIMDKSWLRLYNPGYKKLGGGSRVKGIRVSDEWNDMTKNAETTSEYGQEYSYRDEANRSTGVATYEPQLGGDENSLKHPLFFDVKNLLAPDNHFYQEAPIAESLYPSPSVGYSMVTVTNLKHQGVVRHATGKVVHEFYTAKDFPTIPGNTDVYTNRDRTDPVSILKLFDIHTRDYVTSTQGFSVELNDMHGKPKKESVYQEGQPFPITTVEYYYKQQPYQVNSFRLNNNVTVIHPDGSVSPAEVGVTFDMVGDMREEHDETTSAGMMLNADIIPPYIPIPGPWPSYSNEKTQFRSATLTKVIQRFGILDKVIKRDLGSVGETENLAYDSQTGNVLLTKATTDYNDSIFTMNFPAYWYYDGMGQAYKNIGFALVDQEIISGVVNIPNANLYFAAGDEVELVTGITGIRGWVTNVQDDEITIVDKSGSGTAISGNYNMKVIRSGRRNLLDASMASTIMRTNPLTTIKTNKCSHVLQASAQIYSDTWKAFCDCYPTVNSIFTIGSTTNPYILGTKGNWRVSRAYTHLSPRSQSYYDNNTNIRDDGTFTSFTPFYKLVNGNWQKDEYNWTYAAEVTEFSPFGQELENRDALGRFSAATFGFNQTLPTAVAGNSKYSDIGFDSFEDYGFSPCADNHFKFPYPNNHFDNTVSHTGRTSLTLTGISVVMSKKIVACPTEPCSLAFNPTDSPPTIGYAGATGNVQFSYNILSGSPSIGLSPDGAKLMISIGSYNCSIEVTITDSSGCQITQIFSYSSP